MNKLKSIDFKAFFLNHGEKLGFGVAVLLAITVLGMANRETFDKTPVEFETASQQAQTEIDRSKWPAEEKEKEFALVPFTNLKQQKLQNLDEEPYRYIVEMSPKMYPREAQVKDVVLFPVEDLLVYTGRTAIYTQVPPEGTETGAESTDLADASKAKPEDEKAVDDEFGRSTTRPTGTAGTSALPPGDPLSGQGVLLGAPAPLGSDYVPPGHDPAMDPAAMAASMGDMYSMVSMAPSSNRTGRGLRYNSVVGIVPHRKIMDAYKTALHLPSPEMAASRIQYRDFVIQRQRALPGNDQWTEWRSLDLEAVLKSIQTEWDLFDEEVVSVLVTDPVFTMPLPPRAMGIWDTHGSHPRMKQYLLSEDEKEKERKKNEAAAAELLAKQQKSKTGGGFSGLQLDIGRGRRSMDQAAAMTPGLTPTMHGPGLQAGGHGGMMPSMPSMGSRGHSGPSRAHSSAPTPSSMMAMQHSVMPMAGGNMNADMMMMGGADMVPTGPANTSDILLFRFIDFEIEPGQTYRYRVQLSVRNPSYQMPVEQVENLAVTQGETRETPWSEPTAPAAVDDDVKYFVTKIPRTQGKPRDRIQMDVLQWDTALGTLEQAKGLAMAMGQHIGGTARTDRLDVVKETLDSESVTIFGQDMLVDWGAAPIATSADHPDLSITQRDLSNMLDNGLLDEAVTVDPNGQLELTTKVAVADIQAREEDRYKRQMKEYEEFRDKEEEAAGSSLDQLAGEVGVSAGGKKGKDKNKRRVNPASMMMMMMDPSMMYGGGGPAGGHGATGHGAGPAKKAVKKKPR